MIRQGKPISLSKRLQAIADMVPAGERLADVGCDHGFLDIFLVQTGKIPGAVAMDVRKGPLAAATAHVKEAGLEREIETRLSDGLSAFSAGEAKTLVIAGMGGKLTQRILTAFPEKTESFQDFLFQPQSELMQFRAFLRENGYEILDERIILEDGKYYFPMLARQGGVKAKTTETESSLQEVYDRYGEGLIRKKEPLFLQYLSWQKEVLEGILQKLPEGEDGSDRTSLRREEVMQEWKALQRAMELTN